ncbi:unnamed protein product, partial [marine sediment metagenome]
KANIEGVAFSAISLTKAVTTSIMIGINYAF